MQIISEYIVFLQSMTEHARPKDTGEERRIIEKRERWASASR